jgi:hypothetical protein
MADDGENYQTVFACGRAAAWDKPRSAQGESGGGLVLVY